MGNLSAFMRPEKAERKVIKYVASKDFIDEKGNPIEWEIMALTAKESNDIMDACTKRIPTNKTRTQFTQELDRNLYLSRLIVASVKYPNLHDAELVKFYGVNCAEDLIRTMLSQQEYNALALKISDLNGGEDFEAGVDYVKN